MVALLATTAHHGIEVAAGVGLPGEPFLGRRRATLGWAAALTGGLAAASSGGRRWDRALAAGNGALEALALQHYLLWPWRVRAGLPRLTSAEGIPERWLGSYNAVLLVLAASAAVGSARECPRPQWHLAGLATLPLQYASARHHLAWLDRSRPATAAVG